MLRLLGNHFGYMKSIGIVQCKRIFQFLFVISEKYLFARRPVLPKSASRTWNAMHNPWNRYRQSDDSIHDRTKPRPSHAPANTTPKKKETELFGVQSI